MPKVSIIVPVYNMEKYLERCLNSLVNQTLQDIEIICIDDGSTDKSYEMLLSYAANDKRIKVLRQNNMLQGAARNRGLDIATGEFITLVDSDDWLELNYCELLYNAAQKYNVNIAASSTTRDYDNRYKYHLKLTEEKVYHGTSSIVKALQSNFITHSKLYRFAPIKDLRFEESVSFEDGPYTLKAFDMEQSLVTVPEARYHYYSNPTSTVKQKMTPKLENDKISTSLQMIRYAKLHNIDIGEGVIIKNAHLLWTIKHYYDRKDFYLCGIKMFSKHVPFDNVKNFVVFNTACFGDVLLCNSLVRNIKNIFPESRVIFVCDKNWAEIAKLQEGVDDVVVYDKKGAHKGFCGLLKFIKEFKYKKIYASFVTYKQERNYLVARLLGSRFVFTPNKLYKDKSTQEKHNLLLAPLTTKPVKNYPLKVNLPCGIKSPLQDVVSDNEYVAMCCISKNPIKDMPINLAKDLINKLSSELGKKVVLVGAGEKTLEYSRQLEKECNFINLVNKTNLLELGQVLKNSEVLISVDTGTMHYGYSLGVKTLCLFFEEGTTHLWAPDSRVYENTIVLNENISVDSVLENYFQLRGKDRKNV